MRILQIILLCFIGQYAIGQFSLTNLTEVQVGKLPDENRPSFVSLYDRFIVNYRIGNLKLSATAESYVTPISNRNFAALSQASLSYRKKRWSIKLGNFYETIGRGLLIRSFEIQGALLEDFGFRSRNYFHRDHLGALVKYKGKKFNVTTMYSQVLNNALPPTFERAQRRNQSVYAVAAEYKLPKRQKIGASYVVIQDERLDLQHLYSVSLTGPLFKVLNYYVEFANAQSSINNNALYAGVNGFIGDLSFNIEYKNYQDFIIGNGFNEPPALIKQQTYRTLNRSVHVTNPLDESGYQIDLFYTFNEHSSINVNHALASNEFGSNTFNFREYFAEWKSVFGNYHEYKVFVDYAEDPFKRESRRVSVGTYWELGLHENIRLLPQVEYQTFIRPEGRVENQSYALALQAGKDVAVSLVAERTTDPFLIFDESTTERWYVGGNLSVKPHNRHTLNFFLGERRGGPLCTAGVCYEILDFQGLEVRWTGRF